MSEPASWCSHGCVIAATCMQFGRYTANLIWHLPISCPGARSSDRRIRRLPNCDPLVMTVHCHPSRVASTAAEPTLTMTVSCHSVTLTPAEKGVWRGSEPVHSAHQSDRGRR